MIRSIKIRDLSLRDGQQSLFATRMSQAQVERVLPLYRDASFYAMEVWGGAVPDSVMRYLNENPWYRLESIYDAMKGISLLTALSRGRNLFGYSPYPDEVIEGFNRLAIQSGVGVMRIFDALNDLDNVRSTIKYVKQNGGIADCCVCYTVDPHFSALAKIKALLHAKPLNYHIFTNEYYLDKARILEEMGADIITIKDMAGLITPSRAGALVRLLKENIKVPIDLHTHCTPGFGLASVFMAIVNGSDIVDTNMLAFSGGTAAPAFEIVQLFCDKLKIDTGVNREAVSKINLELIEIRKELADFDDTKLIPKQFNLADKNIDPELDTLIKLSVKYAKADKETELLEVCHEIESYFNLPQADERIRKAEVPGGMYSNMLAQLKQLKLEKLLPKALELIPMVRLASGCPPLVTPTSQIVGVQAVNCAMDIEKGQALYTTKSIQFVNLVKGVYGKTPVEIDPEFRYKITGVREETPYNTMFYNKQNNPVFEEYGGVKLAKDEKELLLLELFPQVTFGFLKNQIETQYLNEIHRVEEEKRLRFEEIKRQYENLSPEQKEQRLQQGLYSYPWTSYEDDAVMGRS
jgi:oxaloacetate decarboxylase alpha subunit/pyruvate carboxylase subunit B